MTKRYQHIHTLVRLRSKIGKYPQRTDELLYAAIVDSLPSAHDKLYHWIYILKREDITTSFVMKGRKYSEPYASTLLNELWQFGLLTRKKDEESNQYIYNIAD